MSFNVYGRTPRPPHVPLETGTYVATVAQIIDLGTHPDPWDTKKGPCQRASISFQLDAEPIEYTKDGVQLTRQPWVSCEVKCVLGSKDYPSTLRQIVESCMGKAPDDPNAGVDIAALLGRGCQVQIGHGKPRTDGSVWEKVAGVIGLAKGQKAPKLEIPPRLYVAVENGVFTPPPEWVPGFLARKILESFEARGETPSGPEARPAISEEENPF